MDSILEGKAEEHETFPDTWHARWQESTRSKRFGGRW